nr:unnamed protein product [Callosobruchus analis]
MYSSKRLFKCPHCVSSYKYKKHLTSHLRFKCGKEPSIWCPYCPKKFHRPYELNSHLKSKHLTHPDEIDCSMIEDLVDKSELSRN